MATKRDTHNQNLPVHDIISLKDKIRELKNFQDNLTKENEQILVDIANKEKLFAKYRQELTLLEPTKDLRWQATDLASEEGFTPAEIAKYNSMNEKIEMQILIAELHQSLPALEQKMKLYEERAKTNSKIVPKSMKTLIQQANAQLQHKKPADQEQKFDSILWKNATELEELIDQRIQEMVDIKKNQHQQHDASQQSNQQLIDEIIASRHRVELMFKEKALLRKEQVQVITKTIHKYKYDYLGEEIRTLRNRLRRQEDGFGWLEKLFVHHLSTTASSGKIQKNGKLLASKYFTLNKILLLLAYGLLYDCTLRLITVEDEMTGSPETMKLSEVGVCLHHVIFPKKTPVDEEEHPYWTEERFLRRLLQDILYEELLSKERTSLTVEQLMKADAQQSKTLLSDERNDAVIAEEEEDDFDADVELLTTVVIKKPFQHDAPQVTIPTYREKELLEEAKDQSRTLNDLDVNMFCLLSNRIIAEVE